MIKRNPHTTPTLLIILANALVHGNPSDLLHAIDFYELGFQKCEFCGFYEFSGCQCEDKEPCDECDAFPCMCDWTKEQVKKEAIKFAEKVLDDKQLRELKRKVEKIKKEVEKNEQENQIHKEKRRRYPHYSSKF